MLEESAGIHRNREGPFEKVAAGTNHKDIPDRVIRVELITRGCASRFLHPDKASLLLVECLMSGRVVARPPSPIELFESDLQPVVDQDSEKASVVGGRYPSHTLERDSAR